jgi:hypothetical protein
MRSKEALRAVSIFALTAALGLSHPTSIEATDTCPLEGKIITVTELNGVRLRSTATTRALTVAKIPQGEEVSLIDTVEGQNLSIKGETSNIWDHVKTRSCKEGYVHSRLLSESGQPENKDIKAEGIFSCLNIEITSATIGRYGGNTWNISTPRGLANLNSLNGRHGWFNSEEYKKPHGGQPYDHFSYPLDGSFYGYILLHHNGGDDKQVWAWKGNTDPDLLVWVYQDLETNADSNGNHMGAHHFCWWGSVDQAAWDAATGSR